MKFKESVEPPVSGEIQSYLVPRNDKGVKILLDSKSNVVVYSAADLLARILAGDERYLPKHVGFIYGTDSNPGLEDPDQISGELKRAHDWSKITTDVEGIPSLGNILIAPLSCAPSVSLDGDASRYQGNAVTFAAHTGTVSEYAFPTDGVNFAQSISDLEDAQANVKIYHVILLNRFRSGRTITYTPFSRAALESQPFTTKPDAFDLGVYWTITFK